jgi:arginyl-tRNA synthetase
MAGIEQSLRDRLATAFETVAGVPVDPAVQRSQRADYQSNAALALAKRLKANPRELAERVVAHAALADLCDSVEISGPGFINLTIADAALGRLLGAVTGDDRLGVPAVDPETVVVDYSAPNAAKEMHVGHLRSTVIGDAVVRLLEWLGHRVIRQNHLGDWGTPFGMLLEHFVDAGDPAAADDLNAFYAAARAKFDASDEFRQRSRRRVVLLQAGDEPTMRLWHSLVEISQRYFMSVYRRLDTRLREGDFVGESAYNADLDGVVADLDRLGLLRQSEGADCVFPPGFTNRDGEPLPLIVRKSDGGYGYAATDLAALRHRVDDLKATRLLYVVGTPQRQHLAMVFATAAEAGWLAPPVRATQVAFGSVLGPDGKVLRSRLGGAVKLTELLDEAIERATAVIPDEAVSAEVARAVGMGAIKYADLSNDRVKDYVFDFDRMLAFNGNTSVYLQYAHVRIRSIFRQGGITPLHGGEPITVGEPSEHALALELLSFPVVVEEVAESLEFHRLTGYLYGLSTTFTSFYGSCPVLKADEPVRSSRLALCDLTARVLQTGLGLLGIAAPERM